MKTKILYLLLVIILLPGCVKESIKDCPEAEPSRFTYFSYKGDGIDEIFQEKIENVCLFIFDEQELYVDRIDLNKNDLLALQGVYLDLPEGIYDIICWGNILSNTQIEENDQIVDCHMNHFTDSDDLDIESSDPLYYGRKIIEVTNKSQTDTIHFVSAHIKMNLSIINSGLNVSGNNNNRLLLNENTKLRIEVGNLSESVDFYLDFSTIKMSYYPSLNETGSDKISAKFNVLRFQDKNDVYITLRDTDTSEVIISMGLSEFMEKYNIKVTGINEAVVNVTFIFNGTTISIQPWGEEDIKPGM